MKPKFIAFVATSVDGRISLTRKASPDWTSKEDWRFFQDSLSKIDAVVVGRNTYEAARRSLRKRKTYVLSSHLPTLKRMGLVTFINPRRINLQKLLAEYKTVAVLGGSGVYRHMFESDLIDEIYVTYEPLIFGRGKEMVTDGKQTIRLSLLSVRRLNRKGTLLAHYKIDKKIHDR